VASPFGKACASCTLSYRILATRCEVLSPRMVRVLEDLDGAWRWLDERRTALGKVFRQRLWENM
jgi:hypothetical protein